jgi:hypothetical protein
VVNVPRCRAEVSHFPGGSSPGIAMPECLC